MNDLKERLLALRSASVNDQMTGLTRLLSQESRPNFSVEELSGYKSLVEGILQSDEIRAKDKISFGESLNSWGDPRIDFPNQETYWKPVDIGSCTLLVGRFLVTTSEWRAFLSDGYDNPENWSQAGLEWKESDRPSWRVLAAAEESKKYVYDNQPVVGICWYEAAAYAKANLARLMSFYERELIIRGSEKRPYPWGSPFGKGNSNTQEEQLQKPSAVGLYHRDRTPDGVYDLAGNVGEWTEDEVDNKRVIHPGSWNINQMGAWVKASRNYSAAARTADVGFRLVRDI